MSKLLSHDPQIQCYFEENTTWSLISFLKYRRESVDFTGDKATEHSLYKRALQDIISKNEETYTQAKECLANFMVCIAIAI